MSAHATALEEAVDLLGIEHAFKTPRGERTVLSEVKYRAGVRRLTRGEGAALMVRYHAARQATRLRWAQSRG